MTRSIIGKVRRLTFLVVAALLAACSRDIQNTDAVRQGVVDYLRARQAETGLNVDTMRVEVTSVSFQRDEARATVVFRPKTGPGEMQMSYSLDRKGDKWVVRGHGDSGANPHGGSAAPPQLPLIQPPPALPEGHPPVGSKP
jgi:hypothetical protein